MRTLNNGEYSSIYEKSESEVKSLCIYTREYELRQVCRVRLNRRKLLRSILYPAKGHIEWCCVTGWCCGAAWRTVVRSRRDDSRLWLVSGVVGLPSF